MKEIKEQVEHIVHMLETGFEEETNDDGEQLGAFDYLQDALDIEYIVSSRNEYLGARVMVAFGGPNIWINTRTNQVEGYWWNDSYTTSFSDNIGLDDALRELRCC